MNLPAFSIRNPVLVNLLLWAVLVLGVVSYLELPRDVLPEITSERILVQTLYPGASATDVEELVTARLEDELEQVLEIERIDSSSREGLSSIICQLIPEVKDADLLLDEVRSAVERASLPEQAEDPEVRDYQVLIPVIMVAVSGVSEAQRRDVAEDLKEILTEIPGTGSVQLTGVRDREIWVEVDPLRLEAHDLTLEEVELAIASANLDQPGGTLQAPSGELLVRVVGEADEARALLDLSVRRSPRGGELRLHEVARVSDTFEDARTLARHSGQRSTNLLVTKTKDGDFILVARRVQELVRAFEPPPGISVGVYNDFSIYIRNRLKVMIDNGVMGFILVIATLCMFVGVRVALVTAIGIPFSLLGAMLFLSVTGSSLNMISLFSMIIVLGMLVDDAIVVAENFYRYLEAGLPPREAAIRGAREVAMPVFAAVTTTMAAFLPMLLTSGEIGKFIRVIPIVVTVALLCSLIESFLVLPSHLADWIPPLPKAAGQTHPPRGAFWYLARYFESLIRVAVRRRYQVCIITTTILVTFIVYALTLHPPFQLFGEFEAKTFYVNVESPSGLSLEQTEAAIAPVEEACLALPESELQSLTTTIGMQLDLNTGQPDYRKNLAQLTVELVEIEFRDRTGAEIVQSLREDLGVVPGLVSVEFVETQAGPAGPDLELVFEGEELEILDRLTREVMTYLEGLPGVHDVARDHAPGKGEVQVEVLREGRALGFTEASLGRQVTAAFEGLEASHIRTVRDDAVIRVRYPAAYRADPRATEELRLRRPAGGWVNLGDVARTTRAPGLLQIQRTGGVRAITVTAKVDRQLSTPLEVTSAFRDHFDGELASRYPGCRVSYRGEQKDTEESMLSLLQAFLLAVLLIYGIIASLFRSYAQALAVLVAVPFGWCGVIAGHMVSWEPLSFMSMLGTVALTGIVVNDSVVLVQFINVRRREGMERSRAIAQAARIRLRAVILTSLTTICGLCPLAFFATGQARFLAPMAVAIVWGLLFSTVGVLVVVPCSYAIIDDLVAWLGRLLRLPSWQQGTVTVAVGENAPGSPDPDSSVTSPGDRG